MAHKSHLGQEEFPGSDKAALWRDQEPPDELLGAAFLPLSSWVLAAVRMLCFVSLAFNKNLLKKYFSGSGVVMQVHK